MRERLTRWWPIARRRWWIPVLLISPLVVYAAIFVVNWPEWTGFNKQTVSYKTLWDWMGLLLVPTVLATAAYWFNRSEKRYELQIAEQRAQEATLQAYLDQMTTLLLTNGLRTSRPGDEVRAVARARTLTALRRLDKERRVTILRFLIESSLIEASVPIISFVGSELHHYDLRGANLRGANLRGANLRGGSLHGAKLKGAHYDSETRWPDGFDDATLTATGAIKEISP